MPDASPAMREISIGLLGIGTVGTGVLKLLSHNADRIEDRLGARVRVGRIACADIGKPRAEEVDRALLTERIDEVIDDPDIDVVVELMGGSDVTLEHLLRAIAAGKHIVTANKALLAEHGEQLMSAAAEREVDVFFEASVGGGIPILRAVREALASDRIDSLYGIINGTTNYILTRMSDEGLDFETVLAEASAAGYAEADPSLDVDGHDAAQKLAILASLAFGTRVTPRDIYTEGIRQVSAADVALAREWGFVVKLLAVAREAEGAVEARVHPALVPRESLLSHVDGVYNAVLLESHASGPQLLYGKGAGMMPTASAVVSDVIEVCRNILQNRHGRIPGWGVQKGRHRELPLRPMAETSSRYFLKFLAKDRPGVLGRIASILGTHGISLSDVKQSGANVDGAVPIVMLSHEADEGAVQRALDEIGGLDNTIGRGRLLRVISPEVAE
jgi:homoserine dehydrogenase